MNMPKTQKKYCPRCKKHTDHEVKRISVSQKKNAMVRGQRRFIRKMKGFGSFPKENPKGREKPTRKLDLCYKCKVCKKSQNIGKGFRAKKFEITK